MSLDHAAEGYLDNAATTKPHAAVLRSCLPLLETGYANPSALYEEGSTGRGQISRARQELGRLLATSPQGVTFTSGGTEAVNLALKGFFDAAPHGVAKHLWISALEHPCVRQSATWLAEQRGVILHTVPITPAGVIDLQALENSLAAVHDEGHDDQGHGSRPHDDRKRGGWGMVSLSAMSNELGTRQPIAEVGALLARYRAERPHRAPQNRGLRLCFHVDAVQAFTKPLGFHWARCGVDLLSLSAHKFHAPKGVGALVRFTEETPLHPILHGGGQEAGMRSGTESPFLIACMAEAARESSHRQQEMIEERRRYRETLLEALTPYQPRLRLFCSPAATPYHLRFSYAPIPGAVILHHLEEQGLRVSTTSACQASSTQASSVLLAAGMEDEEARSSVRLSFSVHNTLPGLQHCVLPALKRALDALSRL